jgi:hypothetical protein
MFLLYNKEPDLARFDQFFGALAHWALAAFGSLRSPSLRQSPMGEKNLAA